MIYLTTLESFSIEVAGNRVPEGSVQLSALLFFLVVERGKRVPRRSLAELLFPESHDSPASHALRQLVYRLRKLGVAVGGDSATLFLAKEAAIWDVEQAEANGRLSERDLSALALGYLPSYRPTISSAFSEWVEAHRAAVSLRLVPILLSQLQNAKDQQGNTSVTLLAKACLALDPLNEKANLLAAEALALNGASTEAISLLTRYIAELDDVDGGLRAAPMRLRERISRYTSELARPSEPVFVGRTGELSALRGLIERVSHGGPEGCVLWGQSGIGKSRLIKEASSIAALEGFALVHCELRAHDRRRPLAVVRNIGSQLLRLPGALGCTPESLAEVRALCGQGSVPSREIPRSATEAETVLSGIIAAANDLLGAVSSEAPLLVCIEDGQWIDAASLDFVIDALGGAHSLGVLISSRKSLAVDPTVAQLANLSSVEIGPLPLTTSRSLLARLFDNSGRTPDDDFISWASSLAAGVPFYLHSLFQEFLSSGASQRVPATLTNSLASRIDRLAEPSRSVFDAAVILAHNASLERLEQLLQMPRHQLVAALRDLESSGLLVLSGSAVQCTHDLLSNTALERMPPSVAALMHRTAASLLTTEARDGRVNAWDVTHHWQAAGEPGRAILVTKECAAEALRVGRPHDAIDILSRLLNAGLPPVDSVEVLGDLCVACETAGEWRLGLNALNQTIGYSADAKELIASTAFQLRLSEYEYYCGESISHRAERLLAIAGNPAESRSLRVRAAKLSLCIAEDTATPQLAEDTLIAIRDAPHSASQDAYPELIYHAVFGDLGRAAEIAVALANVTKEVTPPVRGHGLMHAAGRVMWMAGRVREAEHVFLGAHDVATQGGSRTGQVLSASALTLLYWSTGDQTKAAEWHAKASNQLARCAFSSLAAEYYSNAVLFAIEDGSVDAAETTIAQAEMLYPLLREGRWRAVRLAYSIRLALKAGRPIDDTELDYLLQWHLKSRQLGQHDMIADTLAAAFCKRGQTQESARLAQDFVRHHRRERHPIPRAYRNLQAALTVI